MKKELDYIRGRYKKQIKRSDGYYSIMYNEERLLDEKLSGIIDGGLYWVYSRRLYYEYGSAVKIMNHIEMNVGFDRFNRILDYANSKNIGGDEFIEFMNNNDIPVPEIIGENKTFDKKLTIDYFYLMFSVVSLYMLTPFIRGFYKTGELINISFIVLFGLLAIICISKTFKYKKI